MDREEALHFAEKIGIHPDWAAEYVAGKTSIDKQRMVSDWVKYCNDESVKAVMKVFSKLEQVE